MPWEMTDAVQAAAAATRSPSTSGDAHAHAVTNWFALRSTREFAHGIDVERIDSVHAERPRLTGQQRHEPRVHGCRGVHLVNQQRHVPHQRGSPLRSPRPRSRRPRRRPPRRAAARPRTLSRGSAKNQRPRTTVSSATSTSLAASVASASAAGTGTVSDDRAADRHRRDRTPSHRAVEPAQLEGELALPSISGVVPDHRREAVAPRLDADDPRRERVADRMEQRLLAAVAVDRRPTRSRASSR